MKQDRYLNQAVNIFFHEFYTKNLIVQRDMCHLTLLHYLVKISIVIPQTIKAIFPLHSGNTNLEN